MLLISFATPWWHLIIRLCGFVDIETYNVDTQLNKVIVTGNVTTEEVIRVLQKIGKNATSWEDALIAEKWSFSVAALYKFPLFVVWIKHVTYGTVQAS